jgi:hypothetical protein
MQEFRDLVSIKVEQGDNVLIYYAGHGWFDNILKSGYWVTAEATKSSGTFLPNDTIYKFISALNTKSVQHIYLISDACFSGSFMSDFRSIETDIDDRYFEEKYTKPSRTVLTSGGIEPVADKGKLGHSIFAYYLLKVLDENKFPYLSAKQVGVQVEELVTRNSRQTPISKFIHGVGDEGGQFFFINKGAVLAGAEKNFDAERKFLAEERQRLRLERRKWEQERQFAEVRRKVAEEKGRIESENKQVISVSSSSIKKTDTGLTQYSNGIIFDPKTRLEWYVGPDEATTYEEAVGWTKSLAVDGGGWRLPTINELGTLYQKGIGTRNMDPVFITTGWYVWASVRTLPKMALNFKKGRKIYKRRLDLTTDYRVFAVRYRKWLDK